LAKPNYSFEKRQRELAKKKKQEEKRQRKLEKSAEKPEGDQAPAAGQSPETGEAKVGE